MRSPATRHHCQAPSAPQTPPLPKRPQTPPDVPKRPQAPPDVPRRPSAAEHDESLLVTGHPLTHHQEALGASQSGGLAGRTRPFVNLEAVWGTTSVLRAERLGNRPWRLGGGGRLRAYRSRPGGDGFRRCDRWGPIARVVRGWGPLPTRDHRWGPVAVDGRHVWPTRVPLEGIWSSRASHRSSAAGP